MRTSSDRVTDVEQAARGPAVVGQGVPAADPAGPRRPGAARPADGLWRRAARFASGVLGADKYERYLQWHRTTAQPGEPMGRKEFWRHEMDRMERNPGSRCC